ncbi:Nuclear Autoantigenic Sperm-associated Protein [Abortiporus biennis]
MSESKAAAGPKKPTTVDEAIEHAKRAFALKKYEHAVDHYATALEILTEQQGENAPGIEDLYFSYGKALLENAIAQSSVLGKEQADEAVTAVGKEEPSNSGAFLSFSGDADEDGTVDLFADAAKATEQPEEEEEGGEEEDGEEDGEPEDDFNAAWEVLDLARAIFEKKQGEDDEVQLKLADTFITLGDVSLETEKFDQAITDYTAGLTIKTELLPQSSRQIAEAHYKLSIVLDLSAGRLAESIEHAEKALASVEARIAELRNGLSGQMKVEISDKVDLKGKGKAKGPRLLGDDAIQSLTTTQMESELKEMEGLKEDLALKVEELKTVPNEPAESAPALAAKELDQELNVASTKAGSITTTTPAALPVNDLTSMVKKKKKGPPVHGIPLQDTNSESTIAGGKRKADDSVSYPPSDKKVKLDEKESTPSASS